MTHKEVIKLITEKVKEVHTKEVALNSHEFGFKMFQALGDNLGEVECYFADNNINGDSLITDMVGKTYPHLYEVDDDMLIPIVRE